MTIWISALIPRSGADCYEGVRLAIGLTEEECYRDLAEWLTDFHNQSYEDDEDLEWPKLDWETASLREIEDALNEATDDGPIRLWKIETRELTEEDLAQTAKKSG
jgi:hypothetical protein